MNVAVPLGLAFALSLAGYLARWLTLDGMAAAALIGGAVFAASGWPGGLLLALFFISGSALTEANRRRGLVSADSATTGRNARQVCANGLWVAVGAVLVTHHALVGWAALMGALAAAQSDTWATEIGARSRTVPRLITTGAIATTGTSGAVSLRGTLGGILGAILMAGAGVAVGLPLRAAAAGLLGGIIGMVADSILGATVQGRFLCDACNQPTERRRHRCGGRSRLTSGWRWLDNEGVNLLATGAGGSTAALLSSWR